jgi:hypothetical protein
LSQSIYGSPLYLLSNTVILQYIHMTSAFPWVLWELKQICLNGAHIHPWTSTGN